MKKILGFLATVLMVSGIVTGTGLVSEPVFAASCTDNDTFLMFRAWYHGLSLDANCSPKVEESEDGVTKFVWTIILNIVYDLFAVVGVIAAGYVIYAGYAFLTAGGDPGKAAKARKSLTTAIIGILVALSSTMIVEVITKFVVRNSTATGYSNPDEAVTGAFDLAFLVAGMIATGFVIYGGFSYLTSAGDPGKAKKGRTILVYAGVGLLIVLTAFAIVNSTIGALTSS